ncbi:MAG: hypothetical protein WBF89_12025 [Steroidobacteraceae bacterium]
MLLHRGSLLVGVCWLLLLSGCGASSYGTNTGTNPTGGGGSTGGTAPIGPGGGGGGGLTGSTDLIVATTSAGAVSVAVGATQTLSITFTSNDGNPISGFGVSTLAALPAGWSGPSSFACAAVSTGSGCVLNLTYSPTAAGTGSLTIGYVFIDNATLPSTGGSVTISYAATSYNNVIAAASPTGQINGIVGGGNQPVSVSFTTDDGNAATGLTLTTSLAALPPGWSSTASSFSCAIVSTGNGCQLPLIFTPTAGASGTLSLGYSYTDDSGAARTGTLNISYATASHDNVVANTAPAGEIDVVEMGSQAVTVTFTTDDGKAASALYLTSDLTALPAGWSGASKTLSCGNVSTGNGCQLHLTYAPTTLTSGTLVLNYAYTDAAGTASTGSLNLAYAATTNDNAVATVSPTGQIAVVAPTGTQAVSLTFTTDDGRTATALQLTSSLSTLPAGWTSTATSFACAGFGSGTGCQLPLTYAPTTAGNGTLILNYSYLSNSGAAKTGSVSIAYRATTNDNIVGAASPASLAVFTNSNNPVTVTFTTDDGNPASGLSVTSNLSALPAGWSSPSGSFTCATVSTGTGCQLGLTYTPTAAGNGTLSLTYGYNDDSGTAKTGTVSIVYAATVPHLYVPELTGSLYYCALNSDGTLSSCALTGNGFSAPTGIAFYGSTYAYVTDYYNNAVWVCSVGTDGSLSLCTSTGSNFQYPWQLAVSGNTLYATNAYMTGGVTTCSIGAGGALSGCTQSTGGSGTAGIAVNSTYAYVGVSASVVDGCTASAGGLTGCAQTGSGFSALDGISLANGYAYVANQSSGSVTVCTDNAGSLSLCTASSIAAGSEPTSVAVNGSQAYVNDLNGNIYLCAVGTGGALASCAVSNGGTAFGYGIQIAIH